MDPKGKGAWNCQRGNRVYFAKDRKSGNGTIEKVYHKQYPQDIEYDVRADSGELIRCEIRHLRRLNKTKKERNREYCERNNIAMWD